MYIRLSRTTNKYWSPMAARFVQVQHHCLWKYCLLIETTLWKGSTHYNASNSSPGNTAVPTFHLIEVYIPMHGMCLQSVVMTRAWLDGGDYQSLTQWVAVSLRLVQSPEVRPFGTAESRIIIAHLSGFLDGTRVKPVTHSCQQKHSLGRKEASVSQAWWIQHQNLLLYYLNWCYLCGQRLLADCREVRNTLAFLPVHHSEFIAARWE